MPKSQRRRSAQLGPNPDTEPIVEAPKDESCQFCGSSEEENGIESVNRWIACSYCGRWAHVACIEQKLGFHNSVPDALWERVLALREEDYVFRCPAEACGGGQSIPRQLLIQRTLSKDELVDCGVAEKFLRDSQTAYFVDFGSTSDDRMKETKDTGGDDTFVKQYETSGDLPRSSEQMKSMSTSVSVVTDVSNMRDSTSSSGFVPQPGLTTDTVARSADPTTVDAVSQMGTMIFREPATLPPVVPSFGTQMGMMNILRGQAAVGLAPPMGLANVPVQAPAPVSDMNSMLQFMQLQLQQQQRKDDADREERRRKEDADREERRRKEDADRADMNKLFQLLIGKDTEREKKEEKEKEDREQERKDRLAKEEKDQERQERRDREQREDMNKMFQLMMEKDEQNKEDRKQEKVQQREERNKDREILVGMINDRKGGDTPTPQSTPTINLKLPQLKLPIFNGDRLKWPEFWDLFENMIHKAPGMSKIEKLEYLKLSLSGPPSALIQSFSITEENYEAVLEVLKKRYDDRTIITSDLYTKLQNFPVSGSRGIELRKMFDDLYAVCTQLNNLGENVQNQNFVLKIIQQKFPISVQQKLEERREPNTPWTFELYKNELDRYIMTLERTYGLKAQITSSSNKPQMQMNQPRGKVGWRTPAFSGGGSAAGLLAKKQEEKQHGKLEKSEQRQKNATSTGQSGQQLRPPCVFCNSRQHQPEYCESVADADERFRIVSQAKRCFICLKLGHYKGQCQHPRKARKCTGCGKQGWHHPALCFDWLASLMCDGQELETEDYPEEVDSDVEEMSEDAVVESHVSTLNPDVGDDGDLSCIASGPKSILQTAIIDVLKPRGETHVSVRILLDTGSSTTWISKKLANKLGLTNLRTRWITVGSFTAKNPKKVCGYDATLEVRIGDTKTIKCTVMVIDHLTVPINRHQIPPEDRQFLKENPQYQMARGAVPDTNDSCSAYDVEILFGQDYIWDFMTQGHRVELPSGLRLLPSVFGYLIGGKFQGKSLSSDSQISYLISTLADQPQSELAVITPATDLAKDPVPTLSDFWDLEMIGIRDSPVVNDDDQALEMFNQTIQFEDGRYQVIWSWKSDDVKLPTNKGVAWGRFQTLRRRLRNDDDLRTKYDAGIQDQLRKGVIEIVDLDAPTGPRVHYLPHHPVITPQKTTTKCRVVYDASSRERKEMNSLNDCLYRGPVILPDLVGMLLRFRLDPIAILADVEKAFLQVGLQVPERDVTRFYWYKDATKDLDDENNWQVYRFTRVAFGIICSPFLLEATIKYHLNKIGSPVALKVIDNIYVDNVLVTAKTAEESIQIYKELKRIFAEASMNLREFTSNSAEFIAALPEVDRVQADHAKVLGLHWQLNEDMITVTGFNSYQPEETVTKRQVLHAIAKIYDPLGYFNPVCFYGKVFLHKLWTLEKKWDEVLDAVLTAKWQEIVEILKQISSVCIPRGLKMSNEARYELLIFSDASQQVYGTAVYLRRSLPNGYQTDLIFSKSRIANRVKNTKTGEKIPITLPRLELLAVLIGVRAANFVMRELKLPILRKILWTDSQCVLAWIQSAKPLPVFIENRIKEMRKTTDITYRYIRSEENPADYLTRGKTVPELDRLWWHGPFWLDSKEWPEPAVPELTPEALAEIHSKDKSETPVSLLAGEDAAANEQNEDAAAPTKHFTKADFAAAAEILKRISLERFSSLRKLLRTTAYFLRAVDNFKRDTVKRTESTLSAVELDRAEKFLVMKIQMEAFSQVFCDIQQKKRNNLQEQLGLQMDPDHYLRCYGRLANADLPFEAKYQLLLPGQGKFTELIVEDAHQRIFHYRTTHTLAQIRMKYWIPKGRRVVSQILRHCLICKAVHGGPFKLRPIPVLPKERVTQARPFQYIGVDYFGPVNIRPESESYKGETWKTWICLFTCLVTRAVHLELAKDMSTGQFLNCFIRMASRRGVPEKVISDNAPNFKLASTVLDKAWQQACSDPEAMDYFADNKVIWWFITEFAPWQGGFYERLVGVVKNAMRKGLKKKLYFFEDLMTILTQIEAVINSRPLTYVSSDDNDGVIITPSTFLTGNSKSGLPELSGDDYIPTLDSSDQVLQSLCKRQEQVNKFWNRWSEDYLQSLHERFRKEHQNPKSSEDREPVIGEIVLIREEFVPRGRWKMGRIHELIRRRDGEITHAIIRSSNGGLKRRPINHLFPLEIQAVESLLGRNAKKISSVIVENSSGGCASKISCTGINGNSSGGCASKISHKVEDDVERIQPERQTKTIARQKIIQQLKNEIEPEYLITEPFHSRFTQEMIEKAPLCGRKPSEHEDCNEAILLLKGADDVSR